MKNDIYTMLNDADINLEQYKKDDFNDIEKKNLKVKFRKSINSKKPYKRNIAVAAAVALVLTVGILGNNAYVYATRVSNIIGRDIGSLLGIQKNLDEYKTVVNKSVTNKGITVKLNEVILDGNQLNVSYNISSNEKLEGGRSWMPFFTVYINGKKASNGAGGSDTIVDDYTTEGVMTYDLDKVNLSGDLNIKILCKSMILDNKEKKGTWSFEFKTNGDQLKIDTREIALNNKFILENGKEYTLTKYTDSALGQKIYASSSTANLKTKSAYDIELRGNDDLGNKVSFYMNYDIKNEALFKTGKINVGAKTLTLTPYAAKYPEKSGRMDGEYKKVGDKFTIDLSKLK
ncbi:DUF4179 domain-containing protein [Clostridium lundense]|uniref:DUF4179 domain-containing protein n=1 Tax=Clostridium lundense TaxID=319475 RepID=UPI00047F5095|nr:DUF4179 domain-containing protein [Clostridium lundense]